MQTRKFIPNFQMQSTKESTGKNMRKKFRNMKKPEIGWDPLSGWKDDKPKNPDFTKKKKLQQQIASEEEAISSLKEKLKDLDTADQNVDAILQMQIPEPVRSKTKDLER